MSCLVIGASGLCGNAIVKLSPQFFAATHTLSRTSPLYTDDASTTVHIVQDSGLWASKIKEIRQQDTQCTTFFSGLASTRRKSGGFAAQYKIDHDLNLELAKAAKESGFRTYVIVSSVGANSSSWHPYLKMKGQLEDDVIALGFDKTVIIRPGVLLGERKDDHGFLNKTGYRFGQFIHGTPLRKYFFSPVYGEEVAQAALKRVKDEMKDGEKVVILEGYAVNEYAHK